MSASNVNNAAAPRQVACETSDYDQIQVDLDVLHCSRFFKTMYDDLCLEEHEVFQDVFRVNNVNTRTFKKVIDWCKEHKDEDEPVVAKDPLTHECKWFPLTESQRRFFDGPMSELLDLVNAANFLDIPGLYQYACQSVAACIKGKHAREICNMLQQDCDFDRAQIRKALGDNPWLEWSGAFPDAPVDNPAFIPNEVLLTIFEKLPREDLERLQLVSTQFNGVIESSSELSKQRGPLRVVTKLEFGASSRRTYVWLPDGTKVTCPYYENLAKRLKFSLVLEVRAPDGGMYFADIQRLSALLPVKLAWKDATADVSMGCFPSRELFEFVFTQLLLCKEIILREEVQSFPWSPPDMRLPAIAACNKLDISGLNFIRAGGHMQPADVVEWLEHDAPPGTKWSEPRQMILHECN